MTLLNKYTNRLNSIPTPGGGGCHSALLGIANLGIMAGLTDSQIVADIRNSIPNGQRHVPDLEIIGAIKRSRMDTVPIENGSTGYIPSPISKAQPIIKSNYLPRLLTRGAGIGEADILEASPVRLYHEAEQDSLILLDTLYHQEDVLFLGERFNTGVKTAGEWIKRIERSGTVGLPHIIPNPVTGEQHAGKTGKLSLRCDAAIKDFRFTVVEFDNMDRTDQLAFWAAIPLPVATLIDSGGKSIHGWIAVEEINCNDEWEQWVESELYARYLVPLGVDPACKNEARLSRLPGHIRTEKGRWQRLLYLNPAPTSTPIIHT